ncbi:MAG: hypothetical protein U0L88_07415 [Acutalibacteraceae bacterium]|nr:hypothetical protein [Acutalibacteraceae bacterium]
MGRLVTLDQYLNALSERTLDNTRQLKRDVHQRRNGMEDLYGVCFSANGDASHPARFYISLSPDYVYLQRFAFKFVIKPYRSTVSGVSGSGSLEIDETSLSVSVNETSDVISGTSTLADTANGSVTPNPHKHTATGDLGGLSYGVKEIDTASTNWRIKVSGVDITPYLKEQQDIDPSDPLFDMSGATERVFPNTQLKEDVENFYDILDVASVMYAEGETENAEELLKSEFKRVEIFSNQPFGCDAYVYMKYCMLNR